MSTREERQRKIDAAVWRTITDADWARELPRARRVTNRTQAAIGAKIDEIKRQGAQLPCGNSR